MDAQNMIHIDRFICKNPKDSAREDGKALRRNTEIPLGTTCNTFPIAGVTVGSFFPLSLFWWLQNITKVEKIVYLIIRPPMRALSYGIIHFYEVRCFIVFAGLNDCYTGWPNRAYPRMLVGRMFCMPVPTSKLTSFGRFRWQMKVSITKKNEINYWLSMGYSKNYESNILQDIG